jgi:hypothetical protein
MKTQCKTCNGTGRCSQCKGSGHFAYPGIGDPNRYPERCIACSGSGACRPCRGEGQR